MSRALPPLLTTLEPLALRAILGKLLAASPSDRYASALEIRAGHRAADLGDLAAGRAGRLAADADRRAGTQRTNRDAIDPEATRRTTKATIPPPIPADGTVPPPIPGIPPTPATTAGAVACRGPSHSGSSGSGRRQDARCRETAIEDACGCLKIAVTFSRSSSSCTRSASRHPRRASPARRRRRSSTSSATLWNEYDSLSRRSDAGRRVPAIWPAR